MAASAPTTLSLLWSWLSCWLKQTKTNGTSYGWMFLEIRLQTPKYVKNAFLLLFCLTFYFQDLLYGTMNSLRCRTGFIICLGGIVILFTSLRKWFWGKKQKGRQHSIQRVENNSTGFIERRPVICFSFVIFKWNFSSNSIVKSPSVRHWNCYKLGKVISLAIEFQKKNEGHFKPLPALTNSWLSIKREKYGWGFPVFFFELNI